MKNFLRTSFHFSLVIIFCGLMTINSYAHFRVDRLDDDPTATGCVTAIANDCSLRGAIFRANNEADKNVAFVAGVFQNGNTITLSNGDLIISDTMNIIQESILGLVVIVAAPNSRIFQVDSSAISAVTVTMVRLKLINGNVPAGNGGAILNSENLVINESVISGNSAVQGGGIHNIGGTVSIDKTTVNDNVASDNGGGISTDGGTINITRSTIGSATPFGSNRASSGGGIYNQNGITNLTNSTVTGNLSSNLGGGYYGFASLSATTLNARNATIAFNTALNGGGIAVSAGAGIPTANINNTIVSNSNPASVTPGPDLFGTITSTGYNIVQNTSGATITPAVGDQFGTNPLLEPLTDNGGLTLTHALRIVGGTSPAIDKGNSQSVIPALNEDQRGSPGYVRPIDIATIPPASGGDNADIGAFELQSTPTAASVTISGRVTIPSGKGLARARVTLTDSNGETRTALTNFFGYFYFADVSAGETYFFNVVSKSYSFSPQSITVNEDISDLNIVAEQ